LRQRLMLALVMGALALPLAPACAGGGEEEYEPPAAPAPRRARAASQEAPTVETRVAEMMDSLDRVSFAVETRDPFTALRPTRERPLAAGSEQLPDCDEQKDPLGKVELEDLQLLGLVTGTPTPRAMFRARGQGQAVIVTEGALAGPNCTQRIVDIRDNEVVFQEITFNEGNRNETVLALNEERIPTQFVQVDPEGQQ
jgi:Tfp pilus assembly protein PilP